MTNLYLIGTIHFDTKGQNRLCKFLNYVRPDTIGIEAVEGAITPQDLTPEGMKQKKTMIDSLAQNIELKMMFKTHRLAQHLLDTAITTKQTLAFSVLTIVQNR